MAVLARSSGPAPVVCDMSSDIFSRPFPAKDFSMIYAGAQKNLGPSGVTLVAIKEDFLAKAKEDLPTMLAYKTCADNNSLYNTPPCFSIYILDLTLHWIKDQGGLVAMEKVNEEKGKALYGAIDGSGGYYNCPVDKEVPLAHECRLPPEERGARREVREGGQGRRHHRRERPPLGGRDPLLHLQRELRAERPGSVDFMQGFQKKNG